MHPNYMYIFLFRSRSRMKNPNKRVQRIEHWEAHTSPVASPVVWEPVIESITASTEVFLSMNRTKTAYTSWA